MAGCLHEPSICTLPLPGWDPLSAQHVIRYQDGDEAPLWTGAERIRLAFTAGENLEAPSADQLERLAASYSRWAVAVSAWRAQGGRGGAAAGDASAGPPLAEAPLGSDAWVSVWGWGHARARLQLGGGGAAARWGCAGCVGCVASLGAPMALFLLQRAPALPPIHPQPRSRPAPALTGRPRLRLRLR